MFRQEKSHGVGVLIQEGAAYNRDAGHQATAAAILYLFPFLCQVQHDFQGLILGAGRRHKGLGKQAAALR